MQGYTSEKQILSSYLSQLSSKDQEQFMNKYRSYNDENKKLTLQRISSMTPGYRGKFQDGGLQFSQQEQSSPLEQALDEYLATFDKAPSKISVNKFREFLRS